MQDKFNNCFDAGPLSHDERQLFKTVQNQLEKC